ncbi:GlcNAc-transferase family protein [Salinarimonas sp.]|uniref:GlcNAc-transferase family protein n=1 Tax=Salinarimonas sp. TaxID=2766526 RepID=UPI0032D95D9A
MSNAPTALAFPRPLGDPELETLFQKARALRAPADPETPEPGEGRIFVSIAAFRDPECQKTLVELFEKAARPERISVGLVWQHDPVEDAAYFDLQPARRDQVREMRLDWRDSLGVCWARFLAQAMWRGEEFYLQIDSHMKFEAGWDEILIEDLRACPSDKPLLTMTPPPYLTPGDTLSDLHPGILRTDGFLEDGSIRFTGLWLQEPLQRAVRLPFLLAGALFGYGRTIADVPYDPYACFSTEEISYALRLYTHGFDVFAAPRRTMWHQYKRDNRVKRGAAPDARYTQRMGAWTTRAFHRFNHSTGHTLVLDAPVLVDLDLFGLGEARTLAQYEAYTGIDFRFKRVTEDCVRARFVPDVETIAQFEVPVLDDPAERRPALVEAEEMLLREALAAWETPRLVEELVTLIIEFDRHRAARVDGAPQARLQPDREKLIADFSTWDRYALACTLAKLSYAVHLMNAVKAAAESAGAPPRDGVAAAG